MGLLAVFAVGCDCYSTRPSDDPGGILPGDDDDDGDEVTDAAVRDSGDAGEDDTTSDASARDASTGEDAGVGADGVIELEEGFTYRPHVAIDGERNATVVWAGNLGIMAKRWESGAWGDSELLGPGDDSSVDFNASGAGVATWRDMNGHSYRARFFAPGAGWLLDEPIGSDGGGQAGEVAIDGLGNAVALFGWAYDDAHPVWTSRYDSGVGWSVESLVESDVYTRMPSIAANEAGDFAGVWTRLGTGESLAVSREVGGWEPAVALGDHDGAIYPRIAIDGEGRSVVAWTNSDGEGYAAWAAWQSPGEDYADAVLVAPADGSSSLDVAASSDGIAYVAVSSGADVLVARFDPAAGWDAPTVVDDLDGSTAFFGAVAVAADERGGAIVVWVQWDFALNRVYQSRYSPDDGWSPPAAIHSEQEDDARVPVVDAAPDGTAVVAFETHDDDVAHVWATILQP